MSAKAKRHLLVGPASLWKMKQDFQIKFLKENGFKAIRYGISERYRVCMEVIARKN